MADWFYVLNTGQQIPWPDPSSHLPHGANLQSVEFLNQFDEAIVERYDLAIASNLVLGTSAGAEDFRNTHIFDTSFSTPRRRLSDWVIKAQTLIYDLPRSKTSLGNLIQPWKFGVDTGYILQDDTFLTNTSIEGFESGSGMVPFTIDVLSSTYPGRFSPDDFPNPNDGEHRPFLRSYVQRDDDDFTGDLRGIMTDGDIIGPWIFEDLRMILSLLNSMSITPGKRGSSSLTSTNEVYGYGGSQFIAKESIFSPEKASSPTNKTWDEEEIQRSSAPISVGGGLLGTNLGAFQMGLWEDARGGAGSRDIVRKDASKNQWNPRIFTPEYILARDTDEFGPQQFEYKYVLSAEKFAFSSTLPDTSEFKDWDGLGGYGYANLTEAPPMVLMKEGTVTALVPYVELGYTGSMDEPLPYATPTEPVFDGRLSFTHAEGWVANKHTTTTYPPLGYIFTKASFAYRG